MKSPLVQNAIYLIILLIIGVFFYVVRPQYTYQPQGLFLPSSTETYPAVIANPLFLDSLPLKFTPIGNITVSMHFTSDDPAQIDQILMAEKSFIQSLATLHGANAVVIAGAQKTPGTPNVLDAVLVNAVAIKI
jgi:hypothetical protein